MKHAAIMMGLLLTACAEPGVSLDPAFKDVQRNPPDLKEASAQYLIQHDRHVAEWIAETKRKCAQFGCVK